MTETLRFEYLFSSIFVAQLQGSTRASRQDLDISRVGFAAEYQACPVFRGRELYIGSTVRSAQPKQDRFRISGCPVGHLDGGIGCQHRNASADAAAIIDNLKRSASEYWGDALRSRSTRSSERKRQQGGIDDGY